MKLTDFDKNEYSAQALKENYNLPFDVRSLSKTARSEEHTSELQSH